MELPRGRGNQIINIIIYGNGRGKSNLEVDLEVILMVPNRKEVSECYNIEKSKIIR